MFGLEGGMTVILIFCVIAVCIFEFINGFHDTANAVATVIYTNSLKPSIAVAWSGFCNFCGVFIGISVAMGIVHLFPVAILIDQSVSHSISMILALVLTAIIWNLGTWYFGIPCSSSHTLIGSIFGVGIAFGLLPGAEAIALNWQKVKDVGLSLLISPLLGFGLTMGVVMLAKRFIKYKKLFSEPDKKKAPPFWIRVILIITCTSVSVSHGSNDGQKGIGLMMIILIGLVPAQFAINHNKHPEKLLVQANTIETVISKVNPAELGAQNRISLVLVKEKADSIIKILTGKSDFKSLDKRAHYGIRKDILLLSKETDNFLTVEPGEPALKLSKDDKGKLKDAVKSMNTYTEFAPLWVIVMISLSLGVGTMIGWKRIVVTVGEKIGKEPLTYVQGASANLVTASTIALSTLFGLPVSTTHVLSSGVAGSMVATKGLKNLRKKTIKNIAIAWLVTLPVTIILSGLLFLLLRTLF
jgi:phosphate/sulfate permease